MSKATKATIGLMLITMISKVIGFARETTLVATYGTNMISDVYITSMNIPWILFGVIGTALSTAFIPVFFEVQKKEGTNNALRFTNNVFNIVIVFSLILSIIGVIFTEPLIKVFAMKFEGEKLELAIKFTRIMIFGIVFISLNSMMTCWLQIKGKFVISGMSAFPYNVIIISSIIISSKGNIYIMAIGTLLAWVAQFLFQYIFSRKHGFKYSLNINIKDKYIKQMLILILPMLIGVGVNQINSIVDRSLASSLGDGIITVLNSANRLNGFVQSLFITSIISVVYPMLSKISMDNDRSKTEEIISRSINIIILLILPISVGSIVLSEPVVRVVFERGAFNSESTILTASALSAYSIGMIGFSLREILNKIFYSLKDTKTPMINGALAMITNIILNLMMINYLGYIGLALATSISSIICTGLLFKNLTRKIEHFGQDKILKTLLKSLAAAIFMGIITKYVYRGCVIYLGIGEIQDILALIIAIITGVVVYGVMIVVLKIDEVDIAINSFKNILYKNI